MSLLAKPEIVGINLEKRMKEIRMFDVFDKTSDKLMDEIVIPNLDLEAIKNLVDLKDEIAIYQLLIKGYVANHQ